MDDELDFGEDDLYREDDQARQPSASKASRDRTASARSQDDRRVSSSSRHARDQSGTPPPPLKSKHNPRLDVNGNPLPAHWESKVSASSGDIYYKNLITNVADWTIPTDEAPEDAGPMEEEQREQQVSGHEQQEYRGE
jgi:hypothetical protein